MSAEGLARSELTPMSGRLPHDGGACVVVTDTVYKLTVANVLAEPVVQRGQPEVLAGERSLSRPVRWVHVTEFDDIASVLRGGELLLSTGLGIPRSATEQRGWISGLSDRSVAGLIIELGSAMPTVPRHLCKVADEQNLPLVALHRPIPFVAVTEAIYPRIAGVEVEEMRAGRLIRDRLTNAALDGGGAAELLAELEQALGGPSWVVRASGETLHGAPLAHENAIRAPIRVGADAEWATLCIAPSPIPPRAVAVAAVGEAAALITLVLRRSDEREALTASHAGAFLRDLVECDTADDELFLRERAGGFGMPLNPGRLLPVVAIALTRAHGPAVAGAVRRGLEAIGVPAVVGIREDDGTLLAACSLRDGANRDRSADVIASSVGPGSRVCVGATAVTWLGLRSNLRATVAAAPVAALRPAARWQDVSVPQLEDLLWLVRDHETARRYVDLRLLPLIDADERRGSRLMLTLETYLEHGGHKAETARALNLERQSLYKRLRRIETTVGIDLEDPATRLQLHVAVRAHRFFDDLSSRR